MHKFATIIPNPLTPPTSPPTKGEGSKNLESLTADILGRSEMSALLA